MTRCSKTTTLSVHHINRAGGNGILNAKILCSDCHKATSTFGKEGTPPPAFSEATKQAAYKRAGNRCECTLTGGCH